MVTGATEETIQYPHMMTATQEEIPYCSPTTSSGKQKKARSTSQPHFRSENNPTTVEADQILLALQQLATNSNSVNFNINLSRISKVPKSLRTTMPTFDGKSEKFELFEDLFWTNQLGVCVEQSEITNLSSRILTELKVLRQFLTFGGGTGRNGKRESLLIGQVLPKQLQKGKD